MHKERTYRDKNMNQQSLANPFVSCKQANQYIDLEIMNAVCWGGLNPILQS